ncbi:hypothetical protein L6R52_18085 [Myxococcota bacterium]|nr:hypothetical protein [Myxococcota bacterium]
MIRRLPTLLTALFVATAATSAERPARAEPPAKKARAAKVTTEEPARAEPAADDDALALVGARGPTWQWRQLLSSPRIGGRLTAVTVDPRDPRRIWVGTEEGALVVSTDGGITWDERQLSPFVVQARGFVSQGVGAPSVEATTSNQYSAWLGTPDGISGDFVDLPFVGDLVFGNSTHPGLDFPLSGRGQALDSSLLFDAVESRRDEVVPVRRIVSCPGGRFPLLVTTSKEVFGGSEDGLMFLRIFSVPGANVNRASCAPWDPNQLAVATDAGLYTSSDGGINYAWVPTGGIGSPATTVVFAKNPATQEKRVYVAGDWALWGGPAATQQQLEYLYPYDDDSETTPWSEIRSIEATPGGELWLATDDGVRLTRDGQTFLNVEPRLFGQRPVVQVVVDATERIAVLGRDYLYVSDDDGATWHPFFHGITRRTLRQLSVARRPDGTSSWYLVTSGELWTTAPLPEGSVLDPGAADWAKARLAATPPLSTTLDHVLDATGLSSERIESLADRQRGRVWLPIVDVVVRAASEPLVRAERSMPLAPYELAERTDERQFEVMVQASWPFFESKVLETEAGSVRASLYELRKQIAFAAEDAWHEREQHLLLLAQGLGGEAEQIAVTKERVEALEAILDGWGWRPSK